MKERPCQLDSRLRVKWMQVTVKIGVVGPMTAMLSVRSGLERLLDG